MNMTGAAIICGILEREGIHTVAGIPGGSNLPLYHELARSSIRHILVRHEQAAGFIAQGMARTTGEVAVCMATSGPGVTNLLTAIADAKLDSIPIVAITGQVSSSLLGTDAFQEIDTWGLSIPIVKHSFLVKSVAELFEALPRAFRIARSGRPGPVIVDVPKDIQTALFEFDAWPEALQIDPLPPCPEDSIRAIAERVRRAKRPVILAGAGCTARAESAQALTTWAQKEAIPVTTTLMGLGAFPPDSPLSLGMLGMHGTRAANRAIAECDLLVAIGSRFDDRATGKLSLFAPEAAVIHIDIDPAEIGKLRRPDISLVSDAGNALRALLGRTEEPFSMNKDEIALRALLGRTEEPFSMNKDEIALRALLGRTAEPFSMNKDERKAWLERIAALKAEDRLPGDADQGHPARFLSELSKLLPEGTIVATDVGQHQMWAAQAIGAKTPRTFLTSGGLGTMGFGLPAAIGASLAFPDRRVVLVTGDGSLLMNIQELATLAELRNQAGGFGPKLTILVMDNGKLGLVRQQQELFYESRYMACHFETRVDFPAIARGFGIEAVDIEGETDTMAAVRKALTSHGPTLIRVPIDSTANVYPMVPPGAANEEAIGDYGCA